MEVVGSVEAGGEKQAISFSQDGPACTLCLHRTHRLLV